MYITGFIDKPPMLYINKGGQYGFKSRTLTGSDPTSSKQTISYTIKLLLH